jgi:hypothetical protein
MYCNSENILSFEKNCFEKLSDPPAAFAGIFFSQMNDGVAKPAMHHSTCHSSIILFPMRRKFDSANIQLTHSVQSMHRQPFGRSADANGAI